MHSQEELTLKANRTTYNSFFFNCALLYEALLLVRRLGKYYHQIPAFQPLRDLLKNKVATELRESNLAPVRNQLAFHFFEDAIGAQLAKSDLPPRFVSGEGESNLDVHYELADLCAFGAFAGTSLDEPNAVEILQKLIQEATDLAEKFVNAAENFIVEVLPIDGWQMRE